MNIFGFYTIFKLSNKQIINFKYSMEFKMSEKSRKNWQNLMNEMEIESQMTPEALKEKKIRDEQKRIEKEKKHLEHLKKYHFKSAQEIFDYVYNGSEMLSENTFQVQDKIKLMEDGTVGHWSLWLSDDDCCVLGCFWRTQSKKQFESWVNSIFEEPYRLDNGYFPAWHKDIDENDYEEE